MSLKNCELFFFAFSVTDKQNPRTGASSFATHELRGDRGKAQRKDFRERFWVDNRQLRMTAYIGYQHDSEFFCPKACVMSSPIAISSNTLVSDSQLPTEGHSTVK